MASVEAIKETWGLPQIAKEVDCIAPMIVELANLRDAEPRGSAVHKALDDAFFHLYRVIAQLYERERSSAAVRINLCPGANPPEETPPEVQRALAEQERNERDRAAWLAASKHKETDPAILRKLGIGTKRQRRK